MVEKNRAMVNVKDIENDSAIVINGIVRTPVSFYSKDEGKQIDTDVLILMATLNGEDVYVKVNHGTTIYKQLEKLIHDDNVVLPTKELDYNFTISVVKSNKDKRFSYQSIAELAHSVDAETANELFSSF